MPALAVAIKMQVAPLSIFPVALSLSVVEMVAKLLGMGLVAVLKEVEV